MSLKGIDISKWQQGMDLGAVDFDFVVIKATEGKSYVDPSCDSFFQKALSMGKKLGVYHFANNPSNTAEQEANWFIENTKGYIGKAIPVLDWESKDTSNVAWALEWLQRVEQAYGCKPMIYMSESVVNRHNWSSVASANYGLWVAKYRDYNPDYNYNMSSAGSAPSVKYWSTIAMWQWTSCGRLDGYNGNLDCDIFYGDASAWDAYVGNGEGTTVDIGTSTVTPDPEPAKKTNEEIADEVIAGLWGNNPERRSKLEAAGYDYESIQKIVNQRYESQPANSTYTVKSGDTLSGIGSRLGVNWQSIASANGISSPYTIYPGQVLTIPGGSTLSTTTSTSSTYTVVSGDTLSGIGQKLGVNWKNIASANGISSPYTIYAGQKLTIPGGSTTSSSSSSRAYTVKSGDTLSEIGQKLGVNWKNIATMNGISSPYTIYVGQKLKY